MNQFYVYILFSSTGDLYYVGHTEDLKKRVVEHNHGKGGRFTSNYVPWSLVYHEILNTRADAMRREKEIKNKKSRKYIEWLISSAG